MPVDLRHIVQVQVQRLAKHRQNLVVDCTPAPVALRQLRSRAEFGGVRSGLDIVPNEELAVGSNR